MTIVISALNYVFATFLPGIAIMSLIGGRRYSLEQVLFYGFGISAAYMVLCNLILLRFGLFLSWTQVILVLLPPFAALLSRAITTKPFPKIRRPSPANGRLLLLVLLIFGGLIIFTAKWNFLISPNSDAGNYETYSNHFWKTGNLYFQISPYLEKGVLKQWLLSRNTWVIAHGAEVAMPNYLYGYPVLLAMAKMTFSSANVSWIVNGIFSILSAAVLGSMLLRLTRSTIVSTAVLLSLCLTPLFFFYSKHIMSEQVALFGYLLVCYSLLDRKEAHRALSAMGVASGITLVLLMKLDSFIIPAVLLLGLFFAWIHRTQYGKPNMVSHWSVFSVGAAAAACSFLTIWLCNPSYIAQFSISSLETYGDTAFLSIYAVAIFLSFSTLAILFAKSGFRFQELFVRLRLSQLIHYALIAAWIAFVAWNVAVRPIDFAFSEDHNAYNIQRLLTVFSPIFLLATLLFLPFVIKHATSVHRAILVTGLIGLGYLIFDSNHSPPDISWMRRYLVILMPTCAIAIGVLFRRVIVVGWVRFRVAAAYVVGGSIVSLTVQAPGMVVLLDHRINENVPAQIGMLLSEIPPDHLVVVVEANSVIRGTMNTFRSLYPGPVLLNVRYEDVGLAMSKFPERKGISLITPKKVTSQQIGGRMLSLKRRGFFERQWGNDFRAIIKRSDSVRRTRYFLYVSDGGGGQS